ncbi:MAG: hypothetical protein Q9182_001422 [Xanthomendoza sp. 2 TL-2023]
MNNSFETTIMRASPPNTTMGYGTSHLFSTDRQTMTQSAHGIEGAKTASIQQAAPPRSLLDLGDQLDKLAELIKKLVEAASDNDDSTSTIHNPALATVTKASNDFGTASGTSRPAARATGTITAPALAGASGCLSAQSLFSSCANAWASTTASGNFINNNVNNPETRGPFATQSVKEQASCLCYTANTVWATQVFDGYISRCDAYLQTASLPATTTASASVAAVTASAARAKIDRNVGFCSKAGDVRKPADLVSTTNPPAAGGTSSSSTSTNGATGRNRFTPEACSLMLTGLIIALTLILA